MLCLSWAHTKERCNRIRHPIEGGANRGCPEREGAGVCGRPHHRMLHGSKSAYASANAVVGAPRGHGGSRPDWFSGRPMGSLLAEGTAGAIFEIVESPVVLVEGRKFQGIVFAAPGRNMNFITHELAHQLQLEGALTKIFMKRVDEDYTEKEVKVYLIRVEDAKSRIHRMEAVGVGSITESVPLHDKATIRQNLPDILEGTVKRPAGAAGLLISMTERQLHSQGGVEKGKLRLSHTPLGCGQVLTGVAPGGEKSREGDVAKAME